MGRGENCNGVLDGSEITNNLLYDEPTSRSEIKIVENLSRPLKRDNSLQVSKEIWKEQEKKHVEDVVKNLQKATQEYAKTESGWKKFLDIYAEMPTYTPNNNFWARIQLKHKGMENPTGLVMSESQWKAQGRRIKEKNRKPDRNDKKYGYNSKRDWDESLAVEMTRPTGFYGFPKKKLDEKGNAILDSKGNPEVEWIKTQPKGYTSFIAYHEDATEDISGGPAKPLDRASWDDVKGSQEGAEKLLKDLEETVCFAKKIKIEYKETDDSQEEGINQHKRAQAARYNKRNNTITVDSSASVQAQAVGVLRETFAAINHNPSRDVEERHKQDSAAIASAQYVVSSLYGLDTDKQTIPYLKELSDDSGSINKVASRTHRLVGEIVSLLDDKVKNSIRSQEEFKKNRASRAGKFRSQRKK